MSENSAIQWTDHTWNPVRGCTKISPGCKNCYAARDALRFPGIRGIWGDAGTRIAAVPDAWKAPMKWNRQAQFPVDVKWNQETGKGTSIFARPRVFCASLADVFEDWKGWIHHPDKRGENGIMPAFWNGRSIVRCDEKIANEVKRPASMADIRTQLFQLIEYTPHLDWQLLTKRPENVMAMVPESWRAGFPANVWMGATVEDQQRANERIPILLSIPAKVRFLSCEPLLESLDLMWPESIFPDGPTRCCGGHECGCHGQPCEPPMLYGIHWVITGGESGPGCRPADLEWFRSLRDQCASIGVPFFMKQLGGVKDHRGNLEDFPEDLRIRQFPTPRTDAQA